MGGPKIHIKTSQNIHSVKCRAGDTIRKDRLAGPVANIGMKISHSVEW